MLSDRVTKTYEGFGRPGGVAFSPSSRYLYVSRWDSLFQYDLQAPDILASEVGFSYDTAYTGEFGLPLLFYSLQLAPDNKIYGCVSNFGSQYLHVIEHPDSGGVACGVRPHGIKLPVQNIYLMPNLPYFRLYDWPGSPCDTLGSIAVEDPPEIRATWKVYPNPAVDEVTLAYAEGLGAATEVELMDVAGRPVQHWNFVSFSGQATLKLNSLPAGVYLLRVFQEGFPQVSMKLSIIH